jgi:hypothetical protein
MTTAITVRTLIFSHVVAFAGGFYLGKTMDADELSLYRDAHESTMSKIRRKAGTVAISAVALGTTIMILRMTLRKKDIY